MQRLRSPLLSHVARAVAASLLGLAGVCCGAAAQSPPPPEPVVLGQVTEAQLEELRTWHEMAWTRWTTGTPAPGAAAFTFATPAMNTDLFNPLRGARGTLESVGVLGPSKCDDVLEGGPTTTNGCGPTYTCRMLGFFKDRKLETDAYQNPQGTLEHLELILTTNGTYNVSFEMQGSTLVSVGLPPVWARRAVPQPGELATTVSTPTEGAITSLISNAPGIAAGAGSVTEAKKALTGLPSRADNTLEGIRSLMAARGDLPIFTAYRLNVYYGVFGELPIVAVVFDDAYVLVDGWTGAVVGPFTSSSVIDASGLLARAGLSGDPAREVRVLTESGCPLMMAAGWKGTSPCPAGCLPVKAPPGWVFPPASYTPQIPGHNTYCTDFGCPPTLDAFGKTGPNCTEANITPTSGCVCTTIQTQTGPTGTVIIELTSCQCPGVACSVAGSGGCTSPGGNGGACPKQYFY